MASTEFFANGMFVDGVCYAAISRNLAEGVGRVWSPTLSQTLFVEFHEHPPLAFFLQSLFFRVLGDHLLTERIYNALLFVLNSWILVRIWRKVSPYPEFGFFPIFLWVTVTGVMWSYGNNLLENTMSTFVFLSVWFFLKSRDSSSWGWGLLSGAMVFLAFLTKGPTGLFPLAAPGICWISERDRFSRFVKSQLSVLLGTAIPALLLFGFCYEPRMSILAYFKKQVVGSIQNIETVDHRFEIVVKAAEMIWIPAVVCLILLVVAKRVPGFEIQAKKRILSSLYLVLIGLSGILPIMISKKQSAFYVNSSLPFIVLALAVVFSYSLKTVVDWVEDSRQRRKAVVFLSFILPVIGLTIMTKTWGTLERERDLISNIQNLNQLIEENSTIGSLREPEFLHQAYLARYCRISVDSDFTKAFDYLYLVGRKSDIARTDIEFVQALDDKHNIFRPLNRREEN